MNVMGSDSIMSEKSRSERFTHPCIEYLHQLSLQICRYELYHTVLSDERFRTTPISVPCLCRGLWVIEVAFPS